MKTNISFRGGSNSRAFFTLLPVIVALLQPAICPADEIYANGRQTGSDPFRFYNQTSSTAPSLGFNFSGPYGNVSETVTYGEIDMTVFSTSDNQGEGYRDAVGHWINTYTINPTDLALVGTTGTAQFTYHLLGSITASGDVGQGASYNLDTSGELGTVSGSYFGTEGFTGTPVSNALISDNVSFTFGTPFSVTAQLIGSEGLTSNTSASANVTLSLRSSGMTVLSGATAVNYSSSSTMGTGAANNVSSGGAFAGFTLANTAPTSHGTILSILGGTASVARTLNTNFLGAPAGVPLASDAVDFSGTITDKFVLQLTYNPATAIALFGGASGLQLEWLNPATNTWVNAVMGDSDGGAQQQHIVGAYNAGLDFVLGDYGVDTTNHTVWAVIDHNSEFAAGQLVPEPSTWATLLGGLGILAGWKRFGRRSRA